MSCTFSPLFLVKYIFFYSYEKSGDSADNFFKFSYLTKYTVNSISTLLPFKKCHTLYSTSSGSSKEAQQEASFGCDHSHQLPWTAWVAVWGVADPGAGGCTQRCSEAPSEKRIPVPRPSEERFLSLPFTSSSPHQLGQAL